MSGPNPIVTVGSVNFGNRLPLALIAEVTMLDTGSPTRQASEDAKSIATKYGLEFLPS